MHTLHHVALSPGCRLLRLQLAEKKLPFSLEAERPWEHRQSFLKLNPAGEVPVLRDEDRSVSAGTLAIAEYLEEVYPAPALLPSGAKARAEVRRLTGWFEDKFAAEVSGPLLSEKVYKRFGWARDGSLQPDMARIRSGLEAIHFHLDYLGRLADQNGWLAGSLSLADFAAAAHLSCIDFLGDVPWDGHVAARDWYGRIKSRPSFRPLLSDHLPGMQPPPHYANLDF